MEPLTPASNQPAQPTQAGYNDPTVALQAKNLTKAIFQHESGTDFNAVGDAGTSHGAGQWQAATWKGQAQDVLGDANAPMTPENQSVVAQGTIRKLISQGKNAAQIAAIWNSGSDQGWENKVGTTTINGQQVAYNVPKYVKSVTDLYQQYKGQSPQSQETQATPPKSQDFLDKLEGVITSVFPGKNVGDAIGTAIAQATHPDQTQFISQYEPGPTPLQIAGDIGQAGLMVAAPEVGGAGGALGRIGGTAALGAASGLAGGLSAGQTNAGDLAKSTAFGGLAGGALGSAGELLGKAVQYLPYRLTRTYVPGLSKEGAQYAVERGLGSPQGMLSKSTANLSKVGNGIEEVLSHPDLAGTAITAPEVYDPILERYPNAGLTPQDIGDKLRSIAPLQKGLVDKLEQEGLTPLELNKLKTAIGSGTYKTVFDDPAVKAGKDIGNAAYSSISGWLERKVPAAMPLFQEYNKELQLNKALTQAIRRGDKARPLTLRDIVAIVAGTPFGLPGQLGMLAAEKALVSPTVNLKAAGLLSKFPTKAGGAIARQGLIPLGRAIPGATQ